MATTLTTSPRDLRPGIATPVELHFYQGGQLVAVWTYIVGAGWQLYDPTASPVLKSTDKAKPWSGNRAIEITIP